MSTKRGPVKAAKPAVVQPNPKTKNKTKYEETELKKGCIYVAWDLNDGIKIAELTKVEEAIKLATQKALFCETIYDCYPWKVFGDVDLFVPGEQPEGPTRVQTEMEDLFNAICSEMLTRGIGDFKREDIQVYSNHRMTTNSENVRGWKWSFHFVCQRVYVIGNAEMRALIDAIRSRLITGNRVNLALDYKVYRTYGHFRALGAKKDKKDTNAKVKGMFYDELSGTITPEEFRKSLIQFYDDESLAAATKVIIATPKVKKVIPPSTKVDPELRKKVSADELRDLLALLSNKRAEDYDAWIRVLFACYRSGLDEAVAKELARDFSKRSTKYNDVEFESKWKSCSTDGKITLSAIHTMAREDNPQGHEDWCKRNLGGINSRVDNGKNFDRWIKKFSGHLDEDTEKDLMIEGRYYMAFIQMQGSAFFIVRSPDPRRKQKDCLQSRTLYQMERFLKLYKYTLERPEVKKEDGKKKADDEKEEPIKTSFWQAFEWKYKALFTYSSALFSPYPLGGSAELDCDVLNLFTGFQAETVEKIDMDLLEPVFKLVNVAFADNDSEAAECFYNIDAHKLQFPHNKLPAHRALESPDEGTGKNQYMTFFNHYVIGKVYTARVDRLEQITGRFNGIIRNKLHILVDESKSPDKEDQDVIKSLSNHDTPIEGKGVELDANVENYATLTIMSNNEMRVAAKDRHTFLFKVSGVLVNDSDFWAQLADLLKGPRAQEVANHYATWLMQRDLKTFDKVARTPAGMYTSQAKKDAMEDSRPLMERFVAEFNFSTQFGDRTATEWKAIYVEWCKSIHQFGELNISSTKFSKALAASGKFKEGMRQGTKTFGYIHLDSNDVGGFVGS